MSPRKLTADDKEQILELYRLPQETTSTLADRFKVSSSTISRFLKSRLNEGEYEDLIQQKRLSRTPSGAAQVLNEFKSQKTESPDSETAAVEPDADQPAPKPATKSAPKKAAPKKATPKTEVAPKTAVTSEIKATPKTKTAKKAAPKKAVPSSVDEISDQDSRDAASRSSESTESSNSAPKAPPSTSVAPPSPVVKDTVEAAETVERSPESKDTDAPKIVRTRRRAATSRRRSSAPPPTKQLELAVSVESESDSQPETLESHEEPEVAETKTVIPRAASRFPIRKVVTPSPELDEEDDEDTTVDVHALEEMLGEDIGGDDDDDWGDDDDDEADITVPTSQLADVQVLPLSAAPFPQTCYLVIDRAAELITHPLQDFHDLGNIPGAEVGQKTLPVFDNHRVARRFSKRTQRVIKVPDTQVFAKTQSYLQARGITRLLLDGKVYSL